MKQDAYFKWMRNLAHESMKEDAPKDYPMGRSDQVVYAIRAACIIALVGVFLWAVINFAEMTLEAIGKMG